jgi:hypothetical protein
MFSALLGPLRWNQQAGLPASRQRGMLGHGQAPCQARCRAHAEAAVGTILVGDAVCRRHIITEWRTKMNRRQTFLALAATMLPFQKAIGGPIRRRRCVPTKAVSPKPKPAIAKTGASFIQPDYGKWSQVKLGMTESEVLALLGKPLERETEESVIALLRKGNKMTQAEAADLLRERYFLQWVYGRLRYDSPAIPDDYEFYLYFQDDVVSDIHTPFRGQLSPDGKPTTPVLLWPEKSATFNHYPRFIDLRWFPSSGVYPIDYDIEFKLDGVNDVLVPFKQLHSEIPHAAIQFPGMQFGFWRVQARNRLGQSSWSEYRRIEFKV